MEHWCSYHQQSEPVEGFRVKPNGKPTAWCIEGFREAGRKRSAEQYAPVKAANTEKRLVVSKTKICKGCGEENPIEEFPERGDRPGKRHARCSLCRSNQTKKSNRRSYHGNRPQRLAAKKVYQKSHPGYNRSSTRRRRSRMQAVRSEPYKDSDVRFRDDGLCCFCGEWVDPSILYPHPDSEVINHIHPISKGGPNTFKNVALAHNKCNNKQGNKYDHPFVDWDVRIIPNTLARQAAIRHHYLHRAPNSSFAFGLYDSKDELQGIVTFGTPTSNRISRSVAPNNIRAVVELSRLWINDDAPFGAGSWFVSRALKQLPPRIVIAYTDLDIKDHRYGSQHSGGVYRALTFHYAGETKTRTEWRIPGKSRNVGKNTPGSVQSKVSPKKRYWTLTGNKREKKALLMICQWPDLLYD